MSFAGGGGMAAVQQQQQQPGVTVKEERHDEAEIIEMAAKMVEVHKQQQAKTAAGAQIAAVRAAAAAAAATTSSVVGGGATTITPAIPVNTQQQQQQQHQTNILNYLTRKGAPPQLQPIDTTGSTSNSTLTAATTKSTNGKSSTPTGGGGGGEQLSPDGGDKKACDEESQKGHFGWATFGKIHIPYILRQSEKYCAVRMVEMKLLNKYLNYLHQDIYSCTCVRSYYITDAESRLLNEINHKHCDSQFGREMFTLKDLVVRLSDANKFYQFLDICYKKLLMGSSGPSDKCGFIRINKESVVPYTVRETQKFVPLFYFEGETDNLKLKADYLSGWDLSYLKFCCKVQGIRNELFASDSVAVISLIDIKSYFPTGTEFEDYWPSKVVDTQLLVGSKSTVNSVHWTRQPSAPPPKIASTNNASSSSSVQQSLAPSITSGSSGGGSSVVKANPQTRKLPYPGAAGGGGLSAAAATNALVAQLAQQQQQQQQSSSVAAAQQRNQQIQSTAALFSSGLSAAAQVKIFKLLAIFFQFLFRV